MGYFRVHPPSPSLTSGIDILTPDPFPSTALPHREY